MRNLKIAWVSPSMGFGFYIQPVLKELVRIFPNFKVFTARWPGYISSCENLFPVEVIGKYQRLNRKGSESEYDRAFQKLSLTIIPKLLVYKPEVIFITGFSLWSLLVTLFKFLGRWKVILIYSGSSPSIDVLDSPWRIKLRKIIASGVDAFVTNSQGGKQYLISGLGIQKEKIFARPYQIPDQRDLLANPPEGGIDLDILQRPSFLFVGQTVERKGLSTLLEACLLLKQDGYENFSLVIVGDGAQRQQYEVWTIEHNLTDQVHWVGWIAYSSLGFYYQQVNAFIFPTFEDIWGMVVLEAMLFSNAILCSKEAGVKELIKAGYNGQVFNPHSPEEIARTMQSIIDNPELSVSMGELSRKEIEWHTPEAAAENFEKIIEFVATK